MRTTVTLDDELVKKAKKRAAKLKIPLREFINQALRDFFSKLPPELPVRAPRNRLSDGAIKVPARNDCD